MANESKGTTRGLAPSAPGGEPAKPRAKKRVSVVHPPPDGAVPSPPATFTPLDLHEFLGFRPKGSQVAAARAAVAELADTRRFVQHFGQWAPDPESIAAALDVADRWRLVHEASAAFTAYARDQNALAWRQALTLLRQLNATYKLALRAGPGIRDEYPALTRVMTASTEIAKSASATRKRANRAKGVGTPKKGAKGAPGGG